MHNNVFSVGVVFFPGVKVFPRNNLETLKNSINFS